MKKILASSLVAIAAIAITAATFNIASAQSEGSQSLIQRIAEKFNLNESEVQQVFDEVKEEKVAGMQEKMEKRLDNFVEEGKITADQKTEIIAKQEEMRSEMDGLKDLDPEDRKEKMQEIKADLKVWAEENGIEIPFGMGFMGPMGKGFKKGGAGQFKGDCPFM